jgi:hypothetical protein
MRVVPGEKSIWADEQTRYKDKLDREVPFQRIVFHKGEYICSDRETQVLEFLRRSKRNIKNNPDGVHEWFEVDNGAALQTIMDQENRLQDAMQFCLKGDFELIYAYARMMKVPLVDRDEAEIRFALREIAKRHPEKFLEGLNQDLLRKHFWAHEASALKIIVADKSLGTVMWSTGQPICKAPIGVDPLDHLSELMVNTEDGEKIYHAIRNMCDKQTTMAKELEKTDYKIIPGAIPGETATLKDMVKTAESNLSTPKRADMMSFDEAIDAFEKRGYLKTSGIGRYSMFDHITGEEIAMKHGKNKLKSWFSDGEGAEWASVATYRYDNKDEVPDWYMKKALSSDPKPPAAGDVQEEPVVSDDVQEDPFS